MVSISSCIWFFVSTPLACNLVIALSTWPSSSGSMAEMKESSGVGSSGREEGVPGLEHTESELVGAEMWTIVYCMD